MGKYYWKRGSGKSNMAYYLSLETGQSIVTYNQLAKEKFEQRALREKTNLPKVYTITDLLQDKYIGANKDNYIIDDANLVFDTLLSFFGIKGTTQFYGVE